jgi:hypothetical protein
MLPPHAMRAALTRRRAGETLFFGNLVKALVARKPASMLFVAT